MESVSNIFRYYKEQRKSSKRADFIEEFIELEVTKVWDAYASIFVSSKEGDEKTPELLIKRLKETTQYFALEEYFENTDEKDIYLLDDNISLECWYDLYAILHAILGKNITVHLCVSPNNVISVNEYLEKVIQDEASEIHTLMKWKYIDDGYCIQLEKRVNEGEHIFIHSDMDDRIKRVRERYGECSNQSVEARIIEKDKKRGLYYKHYTGQNWGNARNYHLSVNSGTVGIERCVAWIAELVTQ